MNCGSCRYFQAATGNSCVGECCIHPPAVFLLKNAPRAFRPAVDSSDRPCMGFQSELAAEWLGQEVDDVG